MYYMYRGNSGLSFSCRVMLFHSRSWIMSISSILACILSRPWLLTLCLTQEMVKRNHGLVRCLPWLCQIASARSSQRLLLSSCIAPHMLGFSLVSRQISPRGKRFGIYWMPRHALEPRPNGWRYFSRNFLSVECLHLSGLKLRGSLKIAGLSCVNFCVILTGVWRREY